MRKYTYYIITLSLCLFSLFTQTMAQREQKAFFVHRNDGNFNVMFFSEVDSMVYSRYDADSILCDDYVTQEIWTRDTVVRIPIASIDSITFQTPQNVYTDDAKIMSQNLMDYVLLADSLDLYLSPSTPTGLWPEVGDKLITTERSRILPGGFIGKVEAVEDIGTFIKIECSELKIADVFTRYYGLFDVMGTTTDESAQKAGPRRDIDRMIDWTHDFGTLKLDYSEGASADGFFGYFDGSMGFNVYGSLNLPDMRIVGCLIYEKETGTYFSISVGGTYSIGIGWSVYGSISKDFDFTFPIARLPICPGVNYYGNYGFRLGVGGTVSIGTDMKVSGSYGLTYTYSKQSPVNLPPVAVARIHGEPEIDPIVVSGDLSVEAGVFFETGLNVITEDFAKVAVNTETGCQLSVGGSFGLSDFEKMKNDEAVYELVHDNFEWSVTPYTKRSLVAKFGTFSYNKTFGFEYENPLLTARFVPSFSNVDYTTDDATSYTFKADVDENVFPATPVGFRLVDEDNNILFNEYFQESYSKLPLFQESFPHYELNMQKPLQINKKYKLYPILKLFSNVEMLCKPAKDIMMIAEPVTDGADVISSDVAVCHGHIEDQSNVADRCLVGICYSETAGNVRNGIRIGASLLADKTFSVRLSELKDGKTYYYCAYLKSGNDYYFGEIMSFETPKVPDEAVDLGLSVLWAKYNIGSNSEGESGGLYGWADAGGTETSVDVVGSDGVTWVSPLYGGVTPPKEICGNPSYDIASRMWGGRWRIPSQAEMAELINNCKTEYDVVDGTPGLRFTSNINGKSIFFPAAGDRFGTECRDTGSIGYYWTGTLVPENKVNAYRMTFDSYGAFENNYPRYIGHSVRAVMPKDNANK